MRKALLSVPAAGLLALGLLLATPGRAPAPSPPSSVLNTLNTIRNDFRVFVAAYRSGGKPTHKEIKLLTLEYLLNLFLLGELPEDELLDLEIFEFILNQEAIILFDIERGRDAVQDLPGKHIRLRIR
jgi:hypothetical protein